MCGIAGLYDLAQRVPVDKLKMMSEALRHRGPDSGGDFEDESVFLSHRRLSILDLRAEADQPFFSRCCRFVMVYNGEIYNYKELAKKWELDCHTRSDTEVLVEGFASHGPSIFSDLNGMFALGIFDRRQRVLYLARDRVGIKPLFYSHASQSFGFASELKALRCLSLDLAISGLATKYFLRLGYIPSPFTIYRDVFKFPQGHWAVFDGRELKLSRFWSISQELEAESLDNERLALTELEQVLKESVRRQMVSDVPLGCFLSGGTELVKASETDLVFNLVSIRLQTPPSPWAG